MINAISSVFANFLSLVSEAAATFWENINIAQYSVWQVAIDIILVSILFYWLIMLIRGSRALNILVGLIVLVFVFAVSRWLELIALGWLLDRFVTVILVAIPIIFQQELRRGLEKLGRTKFFLAQEKKEIDFIRSQIIESCIEMSKHSTGALIVFKEEVSLQQYVDTGVIMDAKISKELLISIFNPESALHDGAVIMDQNKIVAASCVLPHSFKDYGHKFGTRHKAALGLSETTDAKVIVVSEQKGTISFVSDGEIEEGVSPARLQTLLTEVLASKKYFAVKKKKHHSHV